MCLAIPARVQSINGSEARVDVAGVNRTINVLFTPDVRVGDYVYVHAGFAISVMDESEALESLALLRELAEAQAEEDLQLSAGMPARDGTD
jgi:hydrogenase expression/formation protein HypC